MDSQHIAEMPHKQLVEHGACKRFVRRIVKKQAFPEANIKVVNVACPSNGFVPVRRAAAGGGGGGPPKEREPFCGAGGGPVHGAGCNLPSYQDEWDSGSMPTMDSEEEELMYVRANRQKAHCPWDALQSLKIRAKATLDSALAVAREAFMNAAMAKNGADYNHYMDESAIAGVEVQRLYRIMNDIEDRIMAMELPGLFA